MIGLAHRLPVTDVAGGTPVDTHPALHRVWTCGFTLHTLTPGGRGGRSTEGTVEATEKGTPYMYTQFKISSRRHTHEALH